MKSLIVKIALALVLFVGSLVGALAATGRLNHEGTAGIPLLGSFFPEPPKPEAVAGESGEAAAAAHATDASHAGAGSPHDAAHPSGEAGTEPQGPAGEGAARKSKVGKSIVEPEPTPGGDGHGGGHGAPDPHGAEPPKDDKKQVHKPDAHAPAAAKAGPSGEPLPSGDFQHLQQQLANNGKAKYAPGDYFTFQGMPAGLTPEQINEAWQRVQGVLADIERRKTALDLREQELQELADDIARRQHELGRERTEIENEHRRLDARLQKFNEQVKLVRTDEAAALKRNAQTLASFEPEKAAELVLEQWKTERGQDEILRLLEFMDKDATNELFKALPTPTVQDIMKKRMRVSKEAAPSK